MEPQGDDGAKTVLTDQADRLACVAISAYCLRCCAVARVARRVYTGLPLQGIYFQAGIICEAVDVVMLVYVGRLFLRITGERSLVFG